MAMSAWALNPFKPNGFSYLYRKVESISNFMGVLVGIFHFYSKSHRIFCKQTVETLIRRRVMRRMVWVCIVCLCPTKRTLCLYGLKETFVLIKIPKSACLEKKSENI